MLQNTVELEGFLPQKQHFNSRQQKEKSMAPSSFLLLAKSKSTKIRFFQKEHPTPVSISKRFVNFCDIEFRIVVKMGKYSNLQEKNTERKI